MSLWVCVIQAFCVTRGPVPHPFLVVLITVEPDDNKRRKTKPNTWYVLKIVSSISRGFLFVLRVSTRKNVCGEIWTQLLFSKLVITLNKSVFMLWFISQQGEGARHGRGTRLASPERSFCARGGAECFTYDITNSKQDGQCQEWTPGVGSLVGVLVPPFTPVTLDKLSPILATNTHWAFTLY